MKKALSLITAAATLALSCPGYAEDNAENVGFVGFESTFDAGVDGWTAENGTDIGMKTVDGRLAIWGTSRHYITHSLDANSNEVIYVSFEVENTESGSLRLYDGNSIDGDERLGVIKNNAAGVFVRDANYKARRFKNEDNYFPTAGAAHKYEIIYNFAQNEQKFYIDGVEATYYNAEDDTKTTNGGVTVKGTGLGDIYFFISESEISKSNPVYLDNVVVKSYPEYLAEQIEEFSIYTDSAEKLSELKSRAQYLTTIGKPISAAESEKLTALESALNELSNRTCAFDAYEKNSGLAGADELFTLKEGITPASIKLNGSALTAGDDYKVNGSKYLFAGELFASAGKNTITVTAEDGTEYADIIDISLPQRTVVPVSEAAKWTDGNKEEALASVWVRGYFENASINANPNVYQAYQNKNAAVTWSIGANYAGTYKLEWFDISAEHSTNGKYQQPTLKREVKSEKGVESAVFNTTRDNTWHEMGTYTFSGNGDEYVKFANGSDIGIDPGKRFFAECIRLSRWYDEGAILAEFAGLPDSVTISTDAGTNAGVAKIVTLTEDIADEYIDGIYLDGVSFEAEHKEHMWLLPEDKMTAGEHKVQLMLKTGAKSNELTFSLTEPTHIVYGVGSNPAKGAGVNDTAGTGHSRNGQDSPFKATVALSEQESADEKYYVKWDIGSVDEGDYLVDIWLTKGFLAYAMKAEVSSDGGATNTVYHSLHANNHTDKTNGGQSFYTEAYLGNGAKIHFKGTGDEYIKVMLDDDYAKFAGQFFLLDSVRLTPWYDMNSVWDEFYGDEVITAAYTATIVVGAQTETDGGNKIYHQDITSKYAMAKYGYTALLAVYDKESGELLRVVKQENIMLRDGDKTVATRYALGDSFDAEGKLFKVFVWGGDADPEKNTEMAPYLLNTKTLTAEDITIVNE